MKTVILLVISNIFMRVDSIRDRMTGLGLAVEPLTKLTPNERSDSQPQAAANTEAR